MAHNFNHQTNITLGESIKMGVKAPALEDRIFDTWSDANTYIHDENSSAVNGLVLTVINDGENNGGWFVDKRQTNNNQYELTLTRIGTGGGGSCDLLIPITYNALKNFRDTNQLVPGCRYRIIDYVTKANVDMYNMDWSQIDPSQLQYLSFSAEHPYDIIVLATDVNKLSEDARAIQHEGDTYFSGSNLEAWELKYSLDNDTQYSWIQDPFNYGESILPPFPFCYISTKEGGQYPYFQNLLWEDSYVYDNYNLCDNVPQWLQQQIEQYVNISQEYGQDMSIEIGDTYYVPYPDDTSYGMVRVACWGLGVQVVYFNRITVLRITINENVVVEFPVVYDYDNPNVWHLEEDDVSMDIGVTFGTEWEIMGKKGEWHKVGVKNTGKIIVEVHGCKGVVFEMKDEFNNKADYDFKNIIYATDYYTDGVYSFDLYIDSHNMPISIVIPDSIDNPTQVVDTYSDVNVNCIYDDWLGWHIPYYNEQQCFIQYNGYLFRYVYYATYGYANADYVGYNDNGTIDTSVICPEEIIKMLAEYISKNAKISQYILELDLDYTFSKGWHDYSLGDDDDNNKKGTDDVSLEKGGKRGKTKHIYKNLFSNIPVKEYKTVDGEKIKTYLEKVSEKRDSKKKDGEPKNRLSVLNRIEDIRKASVGDKKFTFENSLKSVLFNSRKSANVRTDSSSNPVVGYVTEDASLNIYDMESYEGYQPIAVAENEVHGYVVNYAESQEEYSQIGCRTLPMIVLYAYPDYDFNYKSSITFNKVASEGYYGVTYIECYWFEANKLFFPEFNYNYMEAASYNAIYNYWDEVGYEIWGYPGAYGGKYWQQGDYRSLNHRPDALITFEDSDGNELGSFNIGDDQQDDETIVIPTGGGMSTLTWRTPTKDEWSYLCLYRSASKVYDSTLGDYVSNARYINTQINGINGLMLLPDVFELPSGITMNNINVNGSQYIGNIYTVSQWEELEGAGCVFIPCGGYRWEENIDYLNVRGYYWSSTNGGESETFDAWGMELGNGYASLNYMPLGNGNSVRLIKDEQSGNFTISERDNKCNIAKSNLQFHCKNKEWRFAENAYDIIGSDNANIAENYDGWIDLFGYGTSGWNSGFNAYQPWSTSDNYLDYISYDLTGEYANADWGIYNMSYDSLATVAFTGNYNDLVNIPHEEVFIATSNTRTIIDNVEHYVFDKTSGQIKNAINENKLVVLRFKTALSSPDYIYTCNNSSVGNWYDNLRFMFIGRVDYSGTYYGGRIIIGELASVSNNDNETLWIIESKSAEVAFTGSYNDLTNKPTIPAAQIQSDWNQTDNTALDYIKNKPDVTSLEDNVDDLNEGLFTGDWRTPSRNEWSYIINSRSASTISGTANARYIKAQINNINGLILLPDVFTLPVGINMVNINDSSAGFDGNIYTISQWEELENAGCIFLPTSGARSRSNVFNVDFGYYWSSYYYGTYGPFFLQFYSSYIGFGNGGSYYGYSVRLISEDNINGSFSLSYDTKGNIAKSNLQYHCLNKQWRFAPNAYDIIGSDNANIAENYNGYIDLFGFGTSGWNSGAVCYQPWNNSTNDADYINQSLTGDYKNADWGYNIKKQLQPVAFTGDYNDLENKPTIPYAKAQDITATDLQTAVTNSALNPKQFYYETDNGKLLFALTSSTYGEITLTV